MARMRSTRARTLADTLRAMEWPEVTLNGTLLANICPACSALVAPGSGSERANREQHILSLHSA